MATAGDAGKLLAWLLTLSELLCWCCALRDVMLVMPPVARAGSSVTLQCLYDLESDTLYSVKWYRGNFEFYRSTPHESPPKRAFSYPDFHVDLSQSDEHKVTLRRVPLHMSGTFACEVSLDAPNFSTYVKKGQLLVLDTVRRPLLTVSKNVYRPGDELEANCTMPSAASAEPLPPELAPAPPAPRYSGQPGQPLLPELPPLQAHQLTAEQRRHLQKDADDNPPVSFGFWVNNKPVPAAYVQQRPWSAAMLRPVAEADFSPQGELRLKCVATLADKYREPSHVVTVRRQEDGDEYDEDGDGEDDEEEEVVEKKVAVEEPPIVVTEANSAVHAPLPGSADRSVDARAASGRALADPLVAALTLAAVLRGLTNRE